MAAALKVEVADGLCAHRIESGKRSWATHRSSSLFSASIKMSWGWIPLLCR